MRDEHGIPSNDFILFNGLGDICWPYELWSWLGDEVWYIPWHNRNITGFETCEIFRNKFGGPSPCLNTGVFIGSVRAIKKFMFQSFKERIIV